MRSVRIGHFVLSMAMFLGLLQAQDRPPLTNQRIYDLYAAGVSQQEIIRVIATAPKIDFNLQPAETDALMKAGVSEDIIKAMAAKESGDPIPVPSTPPRVAGVSPIRNTPSAAAPSPSAVATASNTVGNSGILRQGTPVRMRIMQTISSADAQVGNNVNFQTLDDVRQGGVIVIPKGSTAIATITVAEAKKRAARGGKLGMNIDYVRLPQGDQLPLRGVQNLKGGGHTGAMTGAMVATAIVFWPAAPFFLFMHGKEVVIPEGHEVTVFTNTDYSF